MRRLPSRLRRLDDALADLPLDEPMLLSELDGFLTGVLLSPDPMVPAEWMPSVWGSDAGGVAPFDDPLDVRWFADAVMAQRDAIARDLARARPQPILDVDERNGDVLWETWIDGFGEAMALRPEAWDALATGEDADAADAAARMALLLAVARDESPLDSVQIDAFHDGAPAALVDTVLRLYVAARRRGDMPAAAPVGIRPAKPGRNDPCGCGSGKKSKRCCG